MVKYEVCFGGGYGETQVVEMEDRTTDYGAIVDTLIDNLEESGRKDCFIEYDETEEEGGEIFEDEYVTGGNHGLLLYTGVNCLLPCRKVNKPLATWQ